MTGELLGIDLGTSSAKVGLFSRGGQRLGFARRAYPLAPSPRDGRAEQDPEQWWVAVRDAIRTILQGRDPRQVRAVCAGGQGPTLVLVDERGSAVRPAMTWLDTRSRPQSARLAQRVGGPLDYSILPRLLWVAENEPAVYARTRWALQAWDFLACRLAGARTAAASTLAGDAVWPRAWLEAAGLDASPLIPPLVEMGVPYAETAGAWAEEAGLPAGIPIVAGVNDGIGSIVGAAGGVAGRATDPGGAAGGLALCWDRPLAAPGLACWPGLSPGTHIVGGALAAGGRALDWWAAATGRGGVPAALRRAEQAPAGSGGLVFLPFLAGERAPLWDAEARGAFLGLTLDHGAPHLARAVLEGAAYALRLLAETLVAAGGRIDELRICGRQAESHLWNQIKADVTGCRAVVPRVEEVALMGDAIAAAVGAGFYPDLVTAGEAMVRVARVLAPDPANRAIYAELFAIYQAAYPALRPLWRLEPRGHGGARPRAASSGRLSPG